MPIRYEDYEDDENFQDEDFLESNSSYAGENGNEDDDYGEEEDFSFLGRNDIVGFYQNEEHSEVGFSTDSWSIDEIEICLKDYFRFFSKEEKDFIYLNFLLGKSQVELAEFFGKTQPALCNDSNRIKREIKIAKKLKNLSQKVLDFLLQEKTGLNHFTRDILLVFFYSMSVTKVAKIMGLNSMLCRARIKSAVKSLKELGYDEIYDYFQYILENLNKIKRNVSSELENKAVSKLDYTDGHLSQEFNFNE